MKARILSLLLALWLPLFFSSASLASTSMQLQGALQALASSDADAMAHCPQHMADMVMPEQHAPAVPQHDSAPDQQPHSQCQSCGLCLSLVYYLQVPAVTALTQQHAQPRHVAWVSSHYIPSPDQRPPILH